jgi:hypothetical protein
VWAARLNGLSNHLPSYTLHQQAQLSKYYQGPEDAGWTFCLKIQVLDLDTCLTNSGFPDNATRCCTTSLSKIKISPADGCRGAVQYTILGGSVTSRFSWQQASNGIWVFKVSVPRLSHYVQVQVHMADAFQPCNHHIQTNTSMLA